MTSHVDQYFNLLGVLSKLTSKAEKSFAPVVELVALLSVKIENTFQLNKL